VKTIDHAFCTVEVKGAPVDVETTSPYGFDPGSKKEFKDAFGKVTGFSYVPPSDYRDRKQIGEKELLALIAYDRASVEIQKGDFRNAVRDSAIAYGISASEEFLRALSVSISDEAVSLAARGDYGAALALLDQAEGAYGKNVELERRKMELFHNAVVTFLQQHKLSQAGTLLGGAPEQTPLDAKDWTELSITLAQLQAQGAQSSGSYPDAVNILTQAIGRFGQDPSLLRAYEVIVHNRVVDLFNARKFSEAKDVLDGALPEYPGSSTLTQDLHLVEQALSQ
jgi:tetratricopeptide (TPR) repeat protein